MKKLIFIICLLMPTLVKAQTEKSDEVFLSVEQMPEYPGGEDALFDFIRTNVTYPVLAKERGLQGIVYVAFVISKEGKVGDIKIMRGIDPLLDAEALRVIGKMPDWKAGYQNKKPAAVQFQVPIKFKLTDSEQKNK